MFQFLQCGEVLSSVYYFVTHILRTLCLHSFDITFVCSFVDCFYIQ